MIHRTDLMLAALVSLTLIFTRCGSAQVAPARHEEPPATEIRTYDLSEFVQTIPDYPLPPEPEGESPAGNGPANYAAGRTPTTTSGGAAAPQEKIDALIRLIEDEVDRDSWKDNGGSVGSIHELGMQLIVSQTAANQRKVQALLDGLQSASVLLEVDARWALLTPEQLAAWRGVAPEKADALFRDLSNDRDAFYCQGRLVGFNGQTVSLTSGQTTSVVTGVTPVVSTGVAAYDVSTTRERSGVSLQVTPRVAPRENGIVVDVHSKVSEDLAGTGRPLGLIPATTQPVDSNAPDSAHLTMPSGPNGRPDRLETAFNTTVRLTSGVPLVIGGMTREPGKSGSRQLCLILTARPLDAPVAKAGQSR